MFAGLMSPCTQCREWRYARPLMRALARDVHCAAPMTGSNIVRVVRFAVACASAERVWDSRVSGTAARINECVEREKPWKLTMYSEAEG